MPKSCPNGTGDGHSTGRVKDARSRKKVLTC